MSEPMKSLGIRLEGTEEQIEEGYQRLRQVFDISNPSRLYDQRNDPSGAVKLCYYRAYLYQSTLLDRLMAAQRDLEESQQLVGELELEIERLREKLGALPKPKPTDVVLGSPHHAAKRYPNPYYQGVLEETFRKDQEEYGG